MSGNILIDPVEFNPKDLNLNARAFSAGINSDGFGCEGYNQLTLELFLDWTAATDLTFYLASSNDGTNWGRFQVGDLDPVTGIETFVDRQFRFASITADIRKVINIPINHRMLRLESINGTAATTDTITMVARVGRV